MDLASGTPCPSDYNATGSTCYSGWRNSSVPKMDIDGNNVLGTDGFYAPNNPTYSSAPSYTVLATFGPAAGTGSYGGNGNYALIDNPTTTPGLTPTKELSGNINLGTTGALFQFTLTGTVPYKIRVGVMVDNEDGGRGQFNSSATELTCTNCSPAVSPAPVSMTSTGVPSYNDNIPDWIYFDITNGVAGQTYQIVGTVGHQQSALGAVSFDSLSEYPTNTTVPTVTVMGVSSSNQSVTLTAMVTSTSTVNEGKVTFTVYDSMNNQVGTSVQGTVSGGTATATYMLPGGTMQGTYTIQASYDDTATSPMFMSSMGTGTLIVECASPQNDLTITQQPQSVFANQGQTVTFTAMAAGYPAYTTVQWYVSMDGGMTWTPISGANSTTLTLTDVQPSMNGYHYQAVFTSSCSMVATDPTVTLTVVPIGAFQSRYTSNLNIGDSSVDITNDGLNALTPTDPPPSAGGNLCVGVYAFDPNEELQSCCTCLVTPDGLVSLSAKAINAASLTGENPTSLVVKLLAWSTTAGTSSTAPPGTPAPPTSSACNAATPGTLVAGMHAWGTSLHAVATSGYTITETPFSTARLSASELANITQICEFTQINGSGKFGQCPGCTAGGQ